MPNSRDRTALCSPSSSRPMNFRRSSMGLHTFQDILRSPQKAQLCNPCLRNELSPLSQEGHTVRAGAKRNKESIAETIGPHADLDLKDIDLSYTREEIVRKLEGLQYPPSTIV